MPGWRGYNIVPPKFHKSSQLLLIKRTYVHVYALGWAMLITSHEQVRTKDSEGRRRYRSVAVVLTDQLWCSFI